MLPACTAGRLAGRLAAERHPNGRSDAPLHPLATGMTTRLPFEDSVLPAIEQPFAAAGPEVGMGFVDAGVLKDARSSRRAGSTSTCRS
ncbi:MAG: hypothetical protein D6718_04540 [Acidobacteria bacterium]|nr:MAG: hypothetical protein D6718_04540 [Acidobacteriota bacterium]